MGKKINSYSDDDTRSSSSLDLDSQSESESDSENNTQLNLQKEAEDEYARKQKELRTSVFKMRAKRLALEEGQEELEKKAKAELEELSGKLYQEIDKLEQIRQNSMSDYNTFTEWATVMMKLVKVFIQINKVVNTLTTGGAKFAWDNYLHKNAVLPVLNSFASMKDAPSFEYKLNIGQNGTVKPELYVNDKKIEIPLSERSVEKDLYRYFNEALDTELNNKGWVKTGFDVKGNKVDLNDTNFDHTGYIDSNDNALTQLIFNELSEKNDNSFDKLLKTVFETNFSQLPGIKP